MKSYLPAEKSVGGQTCQFWHVQEGSYFIGIFHDLCAIGAESKHQALAQALSALYPA
jgi:hypothetical protein